MSISDQHQPTIPSAGIVPHPSTTLPAHPQSVYVGAGPYPLEAMDEDGAGWGLLEYWHLLLRHKMTIIASTVAGCLLGVAVGIPMKPVFRALTTVEVLSINEDFMNMKQSNPVSTNDNSYDTSEEETQAKLLQEDVLVGRVASKLNPRPSPKAALAKSGWRSWLHLHEYVEPTEREKLLAKLVKSLKVRNTPRTRVLEVTADSTDPQLAVDFVNGLVREFIQENVDARRNTNQGTRDWLNREIDGARAKLQQAESALQTYTRESGLIFTDENTNVVTEKLQQVQKELSDATVDRIAKQSRFELAKNAPPESLPDVLNDQALRDEQAEMTTLQSQVAQMSAIYAPGYAKLKQAQAQLTTLQAAFAHNRDAIVKRIDNDYTEASRKEKLLADAYNAQAQAVTGEGQKEIQYNILKREAESSRQLYDTILQQTKVAAVASAMRASNVRVVDPAEIPQIPVFPNFKLNAILGTFVGLLTSVALVTIRERADRSLQHPGEVKLWTNLPELGTIPTAAKDRKSLYGRVKAPAILEAGPAETSNGLPAPPERANLIELVTWQRQPSVMAEAFRSALASILFVGENGSRPRVLVFTSAYPSEGKTTVISNMAIVAAELGMKVLLIDADLRRPRIHGIFDVPNERGLSDVLRGQPNEKALQGVIHETKVAGVHVIPSGPPTQAASHLLHSPNFIALLTMARKDYGMIFIDTPPMLQIPDARVAGRLADAVVLVARAGQTTRDALIAAKERFSEDRIRVLGTILNDWNLKLSLNGYGNYRAYEYYTTKN
jgi:polysaccharide biosynthesis transport protein